MHRALLQLTHVLALLCSAGLASAACGQASQEPGLFDRLFGSDPAAERAGKAADGLSLPALFADGKLITDTLPVHDLGPGAGACAAIIPLLLALELAHDRGGDGQDLRITLPEPRREVTVPAAVQLPSPSGDCLPLADLSQYLPLSLVHDPVNQRLVLKPRAALPVLMRLARGVRMAMARAARAKAGLRTGASSWTRRCGARPPTPAAKC